MNQETDEHARVRAVLDRQAGAFEALVRDYQRLCWQIVFRMVRVPDDARDLCLLIGGPEGLPEAALEAADERLSLGSQTMAHQLARIVVLEQLFRASKILAGERYHL